MLSELAYAEPPMASLVQKCRALFSGSLCKPIWLHRNAGYYHQRRFASISPFCRPRHNRIRIGSFQVGSALPHDSQGEIGEIIVDASSQAFSGYLKKPEKTKQVCEMAGTATGDLGFDSKMNLHLSGRLDNMIISGGENIYPMR